MATSSGLEIIPVLTVGESITLLSNLAFAFMVMFYHNIFSATIIMIFSLIAH